MKKCLLLAIIIFCTLSINAQKRIATPQPLNRPILTEAPSVTQKPQPACDTLKFDSAKTWEPFYYTYNDPVTQEMLGYSFGTLSANSGYTGNQSGNYYDVSGSDYTYITGGLVSFAFANSTNAGNLSKNLIFKVYDDNKGLPGNLLGSTKITLSHVKSDVKGKNNTEFKFDNPIQIPANKIFYVAVDYSNFVWNGQIRDSVAIISDTSNEAPPSAYINVYDILFDSSYWTAASDFWEADNVGSPLNVDLYIFPYVNNSVNGCSTLPVSIINFKGDIENRQAILSWNTATEFNNKGFAIERSKDGKLFSQVGFVNGSGTTTQRKNYTFTDVTVSDLSASTIYYRLKQIDLDGKTNYSNVIPLSLRDFIGLKLYPNPVKNKLTIALNLTADTKVSVQIISKDGRTLLNADKGVLSQGQQQLNLNIENIAGGSYFIRIKMGDKYITQNFVKQ